MAVTLQGLFRRYFGLSTDVKPSTAGSDGSAIPIGSRFREQDTGVEYEWDGAAWRAVVAPDGSTTLVPVLRDLASKMELMTREVRLLRLGMILSDNPVCIELEPESYILSEE